MRLWAPILALRPLRLNESDCFSVSAPCRASLNTVDKCSAIHFVFTIPGLKPSSSVLSIYPLSDVREHRVLLSLLVFTINGVS